MAIRRRKTFSWKLLDANHSKRVERATADPVFPVPRLWFEDQAFAIVFAGKFS